MTVLDAYAVIAFLRGEPAMVEVEALLRDATPRLSAVNLAEVFDQLVRLGGRSFDDVIERLHWMAADGLEVVDADIESGALAGFLRARYYHRKRCEISTADCHVLAAALMLEDSVATSDRALAAAAREEDVVVLGLPDSAGRYP